METETIENTSAITKPFLEKILKREITHFKTTGGTKPGDNFTSILISVEVTLANELEPLYLLLKTFPFHPTRQKLLEETNIFCKEFLVYDVWIPELVNFQKDIGIETVLKPSLPQVLAGSAINYENEELNLEENPRLKNFILMVDARKTHGFQMANKLQSLDYPHVKIVLTELAKFHALTHAYKTHNNLPNSRTKFPFLDDPFFSNLRQKETMDRVAEMDTKIVFDVLPDFLKERPEIAEPFEKFQHPGVAFEYFRTFLNPDGMNEEKAEGWMRVKPKEFEKSCPLNDQWIAGGHGDCWTNNILFKYSSTGQVTDCILVDLQIARECCIMADIVYFLYTSTDSSFRAEHLEEMMTWYFNKFLEFCKILKVQPFNGFTLANFKRKFHRSKIVGFLFALCLLPVILQKPETSVDMDKAMDKGVSENKNSDGLTEMFKKIERDDEVENMLRERFRDLLEEMYNDGIL